MSTRFIREFGENVRQAREAKGMSQEDLADAAGLHRTHISLIERAGRVVRLNTLEDLCRALEAQPEDLLPQVQMKKKRR